MRRLWRIDLTRMLDSQSLIQCKVEAPKFFGFPFNYSDVTAITYVEFDETIEEARILPNGGLDTFGKEA